MEQSVPVILNNQTVVDALRQAWLDSNPGLAGGHEEGGFVLRGADGNMKVVRWPKGQRKTIELPPHADCKFGGDNIVATFHTHPNTGRDFLQEPSDTDTRSVRDDPDLKGDSYVGEFVVAQQHLYLISPLGRVRDVGKTQDILDRV